MGTNTVNERTTRHLFVVTRLNADGLPVEVLGKTPDMKIAIRAAEFMGPGYEVGTWSYRN